MSNITNLNRDYLIKINVKEATIDVPKMTFWNTDKKTSNMFVQLVINMSTNELISQYVTVQNATDYKITLNVIKPKTKQYKTIEATLLNEEKALFEIDLPDEFTDQVGDYSFEFEVSSKVDSNDESITTSNGTYKVNGSILTNLNEETSSSPDLPILKQLIEQVKSLQGGDLTGYQKKNDAAQKTIVEDGKLYLTKLDGTKLDDGTTLPTGSGTSIDDTNTTTDKTWSSSKIDSQFKDIEKKIGDETLITTAQDIKGAINEVFQSVSNGKTLVANAITDKGVNTLATDTFETMATNIKNISGGSGTTINMSDKTVHFSIDDFYRALNDITVKSNTYTSIFDNTTFSTLKTLHDTYGAIIICNCINHNFNGSNEHKIENVTTKFKQEFAQNDWLKFSYHQNYAETYDSTTDANTVLEYYKKCHNAVLNFANECNWSYTTRLASYTGNDKIVSALASEGVLVILSGDDDRISYGLTTTENNYLIKNGYYYKNNCLYLKTNLRYENKIFSGDDFTNISNAVVFTHEDYLQQQLNAIKTSLQWFKDNGYEFSDMQGLGEFIATVNGNAPGTTEYSVTNQLTNCTSNNSNTNVTAKASYTATLTANEGYELSTPVITMGGTDITSTCYDTDTHIINITNVTGNIIIIANANEISNVNYVKDIILDGNCYFDTGIKPSGTTSIGVKFYSVTGVQNCICGCSTKLETESDTEVIMTRVNWSNWQFVRGYNKADMYGLSYIATDDGYFEKEASSDGTYGMPSDLNLFIGALNVGGTSQSYVCKSGTKICYVKITIDNVVVGDFRACLDESNNPCLYDKISGQYFHNIGTGTLTYTA